MKCICGLLNSTDNIWLESGRQNFNSQIDFLIFSLCSNVACFIRIILVNYLSGHNYN